MVKGLQVENGPNLPEHTLAIEWFQSKLNQTISEIQDHFGKFRISDALLAIYNLIWDDFCGKYLEIIKPAYQSPIKSETLDATLQLFDQLMCLLHPYMPFITEEIWQHMEERKAGESICRAAFPKAGKVNQDLIAQFDQLFEVITKIREIRNSKQLSPKLALPLYIKTSQESVYQTLNPILTKLANLETVQFTNELIADAQTFVVKADQFFVPLALDENPEEVKAEAEKELVYLEGFKKSVEAKLANERFVQNAKPDLVERERQKLADAENKIQSLKEILAKLG